MTENWEVYADWNPWHGCTKISPGCKYCYVYRQDEMYGSEISSRECRKTGNFYLPVKKRRDKSWKIESGKIVFTCFTSDFLLKDADPWRPECWKMMKRRDDLYFYFFTKRIDRFMECIESARSDGDSVGGIIECTVTGCPVGIGGPMFDGLENRIARAVFGIPGVKGIEFGSGFAGAAARGSENNDPFCIEAGAVCTRTNHAGGILGGLSSGMPIVFRAALKPTPSISKPQASVDLRTMTETTLSVRGRHDPCIALRAVPCIEAAAATAIYDAVMEEQSWIFPI